VEQQGWTTDRDWTKSFWT